MKDTKDLQEKDTVKTEDIDETKEVETMEVKGVKPKKEKKHSPLKNLLIVILVICALGAGGYAFMYFTGNTGDPTETEAAKKSKESIYKTAEELGSRSTVEDKKGLDSTYVQSVQGKLNSMKGASSIFQADIAKSETAATNDMKSLEDYDFSDEGDSRKLKEWKTNEGYKAFKYDFKNPEIAMIRYVIQSGNVILSFNYGDLDEVPDDEAFVIKTLKDNFGITLTEVKD